MSQLRYSHVIQSQLLIEARNQNNLGTRRFKCPHPHCNFNFLVHDEERWILRKPTEHKEGCEYKDHNSTLQDSKDFEGYTAFPPLPKGRTNKVWCFYSPVPDRSRYHMCNGCQEIVFIDNMKVHLNTCTMFDKETCYYSHNEPKEKTLSTEEEFDIDFGNETSEVASQISSSASYGSLSSLDSEYFQRTTLTSPGVQQPSSPLLVSPATETLNPPQAHHNRYNLTSEMPPLTVPDVQTLTTIPPTKKQKLARLIINHDIVLQTRRRSCGTIVFHCNNHKAIDKKGQRNCKTTSTCNRIYCVRPKGENFHTNYIVPTGEHDNTCTTVETFLSEEFKMYAVIPTRYPGRKCDAWSYFTPIPGDFRRANCNGCNGKTVPCAQISLGMYNHIDICEKYNRANCVFKFHRKAATESRTATTSVKNAVCQFISEV